MGSASRGNSAMSSSLLGPALIAIIAPAAAGQDKPSQPRRVVFVIGEAEYDTATSLREFARLDLAERNVRATFILADTKQPNQFPGIEALKSADLLVLSVRRRTPPAAQLKYIRDYLNRGGPLVAIRTSSHAFALRKGRPPNGHADWPEFDWQVLGCNYQGHHGNKEPSDPATHVWREPKAKDHPIAENWPRGRTRVRSWLYKSRPLAKTATVLLWGKVEGREPAEPVAWTNTHCGGRVFYTSLGHVDDFKLPAFRQMLKKAIVWAMSADS